MPRSIRICENRSTSGWGCPPDVAKALLSLLDGRTFRSHPAPFSKTERGKARRQERKFREEHRDALRSFCPCDGITERVSIIQAARDAAYATEAEKYHLSRKRAFLF